MADGHLVWLSNNISGAVYRAIFTIQGNESVDVDRDAQSKDRCNGDSCCHERLRAPCQLLSAGIAVTPLPLVLFLAIGCDSGPRVVPIKGVVMRGGQPFKAPLVVTFYPENDDRISTGQTDAEGRFELKFDRDTKGAAVGKHKVVVAFRPANPTEEAQMAEGRAKFHPDQDAILAKYGKRDTTELEVEITAATNDLVLKID